MSRLPSSYVSRPTATQQPIAPAAKATGQPQTGRPSEEHPPLSDGLRHVLADQLFEHYGDEFSAHIDRLVEARFEALAKDGRPHLAEMSQADIEAITTKFLANCAAHRHDPDAFAHQRVQERASIEKAVMQARDIDLPIGSFLTAICGTTASLFTDAGTATQPASLPHEIAMVATLAGFGGLLVYAGRDYLSASAERDAARAATGKTPLVQAPQVDAGDPADSPFEILRTSPNGFI